MKNILKTNFLWKTALVVAFGIAGCNIFNPTENVNIKNDDAEALTYEGYVKFRDNEYTEAAKYFERAIAADSSHSEAWFGLIKAKMNAEKLNAFTLLKYANTKREGQLPLAGMPLEEARELKQSVDTVNVYANLFKAYDDAGKLDGVISLKNKSVSDGFIILQTLNAMLVLRQSNSCNSDGDNRCNIGEILNDVKENPSEVLGAFHGVLETCVYNPGSISDYAGSLTKEWNSVNETITENAQDALISSMCQTLASETDTTGKDEYEQAKAITLLSSQFSYSDFTDDDADGCIDEEIFDGEDNDGDGEIDEDTRDKTVSIEYDYTRITANSLKGKTEKTSLLIVAQARPNDKYMNVDINMDGILYDPEDNTDEWDFIYKSYDDRVRYGDHRFKFAQNLVYNPEGLSLSDYLAIKQDVARDRNLSSVKYPLEVRKQVIGGCWVYYTDEDFENWFKGRE